MDHFNIPQSKFIENSIYTSICRIGNTVKNGYIGPDTASAIDINKQLSIKKAFSEIVERRALMFGNINNTPYIDAFELISNKPAVLNSNYATYNQEEDLFTDTTGSAAHYSSKSAIYSALLELIEKNALFLFWYGKKGHRITNQQLKEVKSLSKNTVFNHLNNTKKLMVFESDFFHPLHIVYTIVIDQNIIVSSGVGSSFCFEEALQHSFNEAYLLLWKNESLLLFYRNDSDYRTYSESPENILTYLNQFPTAKEINQIFSYKSQNKHIPDLLDTLPPWIEKIYLIPLTQCISKHLKCIKIFSPYMYNHIPSKKNINLNNPMNVYTINLKSEQMAKIPDCIVT
ncbi:YcaO-like family protein [Paenibacillus kandeliae]|uniref:YcaO-like family protein n=1 Tax=Paenibacillus kandeliae TaxID=3231269 RepID=UPI003458DD48